MTSDINSNRRRQLLLQLGAVLLAWAFVAGLGWSNDGLWFQGDAPRHAANSLFLKEFLLSGSLDPKDFALRYYARYPVISPANYPPLFYVLAGALYAASHPSPYAAKVLVLLFALLAACYMLAWLRRWIDERAGWAAALLLLTPGFVLWSNAVMLNVPAAALSLAALYHAKRWMEVPPGPAARRQLYASAAFSVAAALTHFIAGFLVFMILAWIVFLRQWDKVRDFRTLLSALISGMLLLPFYYVAQKWAPIHAGFVSRSLESIGSKAGWTYYPKILPDLAGFVPLAVGLLGFAAGIANRRWRRETGLLAVLFLVNYLVLSLILARDGRYGLLFCLPPVCFCAMAVQAAVEWLGRVFVSFRRAPGAATGIFAMALCVGQAWLAARTSIPRVEGMHDVVEYIERVAPAEPVFYDGYYHNVFAFYLQAGDPGYQRRVALGAKLLYASAINPRDKYRSFADSREDIVRLLQTRGGFRWLVIEQSRQSRKIPAAVLLRQALQSPGFEFVRSFPLSGPGLERIDVYRFVLDMEPVDEVDLPFPNLGKDARFKVRPIER